MAAARLRPAAGDDWDWIVARHGDLYAREFGWDETFRALVRDIVAVYVAGPGSDREAAWVAEVGAERAGCVMCTARDASTAQLRVLLVDPAYRGLGVAALLVGRCVEFARAAGYDRMELWTTDSLMAARRVYDRAGFEQVASAPVRRFGLDMTDQTLRLTL